MPGQPTTTSNFTGKAAGFYISAALKESKSLEYLTTMENIKFKSNIQRMAMSDVIKNATCNFEDMGYLALTEKVLEPKNLQINLQLCKKELLDSWEALQMSAGAGAPPPPAFDSYVISYASGIIAEGVENNIWTGNNSNGQFEGFLSTNGYLMPTGTNADLSVVQTANIAAYTAANVIANIQVLVAAISAQNYVKEDLVIYMSAKTWKLYISAASALTSFTFGNMNSDYTKVFEGIKLAVCPGMPDDTLVAALPSNLFFGTDLLSDQTRINILDMAQLDGSDNMRLVVRYSAGVQSGVGIDIVRQS